WVAAHGDGIAWLQGVTCPTRPSEQRDAVKLATPRHDLAIRPCDIEVQLTMRISPHELLDDTRENHLLGGIVRRISPVVCRWDRSGSSDKEAREQHSAHDVLHDRREVRGSVRIIACLASRAMASSPRFYPCRTQRPGEESDS